MMTEVSNKQVSKEITDSFREEVFQLKQMRIKVLKEIREICEEDKISKIRASLKKD